MQNPLVWIDLEMTGLDPVTDVILEIAVAVTDGRLDQLAEGPDLVVHTDQDRLAAMEPIVARMHADSGLTEAAVASSLTVEEAERRVLDFVKSQVPERGLAPLAGNSVHADRAFLHRYMPDLEGWLHYRNVDVSTLKELVRRWDPALYDRRPSKKGGHRALADIRESIEELRFYCRHLFGDPPQRDHAG